nr:glycosyltransferase [Pseudodesulfovibrio alkaliphilus]
MVISQNNQKYREGESLFVLRRQGSRLVLVHERNGHDAAPLFAQGLDLDAAQSERVRILLLAPSLEAGGAERQVVVLANALAARGHRVAVALHYPGGVLERELAGVERIQLGKGGRWDFGGFLVRLVRAVRGFAPDVVYSFLGTPNILSALLLPLFKPTRLVWAVRASNMDMARYGRVARFAYWFEARLSPVADAVIVNSRAGREHAQGRGFPAETMVVVPNGIDTGRFRPDKEARQTVRREWGVGPEHVLVGLMARLDPMKDIPTFLKAASLAARKDETLRFVCVGAGLLEGELRILAASLKLDDRLVWAGFRADAERVCNGFDLCCLSSSGEGFPNVLGEAMACGVPCVTTDVGDAALIVGETGVVVPPGDAEALAEGILTMAGRIRRGEVSGVRERIEQRFSVDAMVDATEKVLEKKGCRG